MTMLDPYARENRRLHARIERAERRLAMMMLTGKVAEVDPEKRLLRLKLGMTSGGKDVLSPWVRWQEASAGNLKIHTEPKVGEQMKLVSQSGTVGEGSIAEPGTYDRDNAAPSKSSDTAVFDRGEGGIELLADGGILLKGPVTVDGDFQAKNGFFKHNEKNVGDDHGHISAPPGDSGPPI
jgi:hypothetical protein